jgi:hypothetical protein
MYESNQNSQELKQQYLTRSALKTRGLERERRGAECCGQLTPLTNFFLLKYFYIIFQKNIDVFKF